MRSSSILLRIVFASTTLVSFGCSDDRDDSGSSNDGLEEPPPRPPISCGESELSLLCQPLPLGVRAESFSPSGPDFARAKLDLAAAGYQFIEGSETWTPGNDKSDAFEVVLVYQHEELDVTPRIIARGRLESGESGERIGVLDYVETTGLP